MRKDLIVAIFAVTNAKNPTTGVFGTGYPVAEDLILTSRHVVAPENQKTPAWIEVKWFYDQPADKKSPAWTKADLVWAGAGDLDAALIRCRRPEYLRKFSLSQLIERKPTDSESWESTGFALANKRGNVRKPGEFGGTVRSMAEAAPFFEVVEGTPPTGTPQEPITEEQWGGASGMPIFVASGILGILCQIPPKYGNKKLEAVPAWRLLQDEGFKKALGIDEERERLESARKLLRRLLERSDAVTDDFAWQAAKVCMSSADATAALRSPLRRLGVQPMKFLEIADNAIITLAATGDMPEAVHQFDPRQIRAINAALAARRPLLVRGEPGIGKSQLARAAAKSLGRVFISHTVDVRTESRDLLWHFDAVARLAEAQLLGALGRAADLASPDPAPLFPEKRRQG
jgi:hypothetical protein